MEKPAPATPNPNLGRRSGPALLLALASPFLGLLGRLLARRGGPPPREALYVYQSYQVGDFFMALPAIRTLARNLPVTVIGRPDCLYALEDALEGLGASAIGFACPFFADASPRAFLASLRNAWALRRKLPRGGAALDLEADPRTAFFLKVAGLSPLFAYDRDHARFFDVRLPLPRTARHQGAKSEALASLLLRHLGLPEAVPAVPAERAEEIPRAGTPPGPLLLSCHTRKDTKNWPYAGWDALIDHLLRRGHAVRIVVPPDADPGFREFRSRWEGRAEFLAGGLPEIQAAARASAGIVATDNFLGHMAAWLGKPVLWINGSSDPEHVAPRGSATLVVQVDPMPCRPCGHRCVNPVYKQCLRDLDPERVIAAAESWLAKQLPGPARPQGT